MILQLDHIPELTEILQKRKAEQTSDRELDFLGRTHDICGIRVRTMTVTDFCILTHKQSPLLSRTNPTLPDLSLFMLVLMPGKRTLLRAWNLGRQCRKLNFEKWALRCFEYVDSMLTDFPAVADGGESFVSFVAYWCHEIQKTYHCPKQAVLDMTLPELFQRLRLIKQDRTPGAPESNRKTDDLVNRILVELNEGRYTLEDLRDGKAKLKFN